MAFILLFYRYIQLVELSLFNDRDKNLDIAITINKSR